MSAPTVSVVMPNYNYGHFIVEAMESVVAQTFGDWELIVVDDNSTDDSRQLVTTFIAAHPDRAISLIHNGDGPSGTPTPINIGIRAMRGRFFAWLSSDDAFEPAKLQRQLEAFDASPGLAMVHTGYTRVDGSGQATGSFHPPTRFDSDVFTALLDGNFINGNTVLVRREVVEEIGPFLESDPEYRELWRSAEYYYWLQIARRHPIGAVDEALHRARIHDGNRDVNLGKVFPALERVLIRRLFDREPVAVTAHTVRALAGRGLASLAVRCAERLDPAGRSAALEFLLRLEEGQDCWDLGLFHKVRDVERDRVREAFAGSSEMLEAVARLERSDLEPYRNAARRRLALGTSLLPPPPTFPRPLR